MSNLPVNNVPHQPPPLPHEIRARLDPRVRRFGPLPEVTPVEQAGGRPVAGLWPRIGAAALDAVLLVAAILVGVAPVLVWAGSGAIEPLWRWDRIDTAPAFVAAAIQALTVWGLLGFVVGRWGGSVGELIVGLRVVRDRDGTRIGFGRASVRAIALVGVAAVPVVGAWLWLTSVVASFVLLLGDVRRRTVWDRVAGTVVVGRAPGSDPVLA